ncbi:aminotransferase class I/II-fold pyridoxal phosphate-dependent enzyme [Gallaecimonas kandeliae]|uniref:aminotransferase class I/II-fold pyridoxal phosphate-dependent enzyme n=1 Tax=Gallaecimonas kandeliae TaxID=3029055 RepID=UPI0026494B6E|nr:aminotransferase class I/II-fold pyridoxal phosphate-dependent enzyme [Gallaecimonas kandeliae]WKE66465.1 aminotransferase class I/II-fold pyridoxal phosphate-dependent enzyme [Gallaecimonas kandeliae]
MRKKTRLLHGAGSTDQASGALAVPIYQVSTFDQREKRPYQYSRAANPTRSALEARIAELEGGCRGFAFASGMAAITTVMMLLSPGDKVLMTADLYGGTYRLVSQVLKRFQIAVQFVDSSDSQAVAAALGPDIAMLYVETPANPLLSVTDLRAMAGLAQASGALLVVDNTFATPYWQNPLALGADLVLHSATKYIGGHSDVLAGLAVVRDESLGHRLHRLQASTGAVLGPQDSFLLLRGLKTLGVRMEAIEETTEILAGWLNQHPAVQRLYYPGLAVPTQRAVHDSQCGGYGGIISLELGDAARAQALARNCRYFTLADSLGAVESLVNLPASMSHGALPAELRARLGITDSLVRLSIGLEDVEDLREDLAQALGG